jgi:hypothetical protein
MGELYNHLTARHVQKRVECGECSQILPRDGVEEHKQKVHGAKPTVV